MTEQMVKSNFSSLLLMAFGSFASSPRAVGLAFSLGSQVLFFNVISFS